MQFKFIKATAQDWSYLLELRKLTMIEHLETSGQFLSEEDHKFRLNEAYDCSHLIMYKNEVIGTLKLREFEQKVEIMQIQIHPLNQGKGIGQMVLTQLLEVSKPKYLELTVLKQNRALTLYKRLGFIIFGEDQFEYFMRTKH